MSPSVAESSEIIDDYDSAKLCCHRKQVLEEKCPLQWCHFDCLQLAAYCLFINDLSVSTIGSPLYCHVIIT